MEFKELVEKRRSIRSFKPDTTIEVDALNELLYCAQEAPTWKNTQTGRYYVVHTPEKVAEIKAKCLPEMNQKSCKDAPVLIVTTFVKNIAGFNREAVPDNELGNEWGAYDLGLANQLLILKAKELGLDTLIMGIRDAQKLRELLSIPDSQEVVSVIAVGYGEATPPKPKRKEVADVARFF